MPTIHDVTSLSSRLACALGLLVLPIVGCSDLGSDGGGGGTGGNAQLCQSVEDCPDAGACSDEDCVDGMCVSSPVPDETPCVEGICEGGVCVPETVSLLMESSEFDPGGPARPIEGVDMCEWGTDNCATTDAQGRAVLELPRNQEVIVTQNKAGYAPYAIAGISDTLAASVAAGSFFTNEQLSEIATQLGIEYPWKDGVGVVALATFPPILGGVTFTHVGPGNGVAFYFDSSTQEYSTAIEATTAQIGVGDFPLGEGGFAELSPGEHQFEFGGAATNCVPGRWGFPGDAPGRIRLPVIEGHITWASMPCEGP